MITTIIVNVERRY